MATLDEFRKAVRIEDASAVVEKFLLNFPSEHISKTDLNFIEDALAANYGTNSEHVRAIPTGSAHLGFSIIEKRKDGALLPRYRSFSELSDIDVAIISPKIKNLIWHEVSFHHSNANTFPPAPAKFGSYLSCGWFRPDHFPTSPSLVYCRNWFRTFNAISLDSRFRRRSVTGGLFASEQHLKHYMSRAVRDCASYEASI